MLRFPPCHREDVIRKDGRHTLGHDADNLLRGRTGKAARIAERRTIQRDVPGGQGAEAEAQQVENAPAAEA
jgi:hypothetical protein